ncbi:hypothetical protein [Phenylobacterium sp.]|uniref:hypothetical protein n=1 Tax=Phenylobacterium sp. TaxID=1871053 RepID=UPI002FE278B5
MMKRRSARAAGALAVIIAAVAGPASAACNWGQNTVRVFNETKTAPLLIPVLTHAQWRVGDSRSGWVEVPETSYLERVYGADYPLMVDISMFTGVEWVTAGSADVLATVQEVQAAFAASRDQCEGIAGPLPLSTMVIVTLSDGIAGKAVISMRGWVGTFQ